MRENLNYNPMLDTFDMLNLQEADLRIKLINNRKGRTQRRALETNKVRRGGARARKKRDKEYQMVGRILIPQSQVDESDIRGTAELRKLYDPHHEEAAADPKPRKSRKSDIL